MKVLMVTDRTLLGGRNHVQVKQLLAQQVCEALQAGIDGAILREKDLSQSAYAQYVEAILQAGVFPNQLLVHTHVEVALTYATSLHLTYGDYLAACAQPGRRKALQIIREKGGIIGVSIHSLAEASRLQGEAIDYLLAGTIFPSTCKPGKKPAGPDFIRALTAVTDIPIIGIGGMTPERLPIMEDCGAAGVAVRSGVGLFVRSEKEE